MKHVDGLVVKCDHLTEKLVLLYMELEKRKQYHLSEQLIECTARLAIHINEWHEPISGLEKDTILFKARSDAREMKNMLSFLSLYGIMHNGPEGYVNEINELMLQLSTIQNTHIQQLEIESHV